MPTADAASYIGLGIALGLLAFAQFAHRQATRPARPKRALAPAADH